MRTLIAAGLFVLAAALPALAQSDGEVDARIDQLLGEHQAFHDAFDAIQTAIAEGDAETLAAYIPIGTPVTIEGEAVTYDDPEEFIDAYDSIITPEIADAVAGQSYANLFVNAQGVMLGNGQIWLNGLCADDACQDFEVKIITIQSGE